MIDNKVALDLEKCFSLRFDQCTPVSGGWLNKKWRIKSGRGIFLVKQYSHERFSRKKLNEVESALQYQILLREKGVPCPEILTYQGKALRFLDEDTTYMVMEFCPGKIESCETVTLEQLHSLGEICGKIHSELGKLSVDGTKGYPMIGDIILEELWDNYNSKIENLPFEKNQEYIGVVKQLKPILNSLTAKYIDSLPKGLAHEDFSPDNILFSKTGVSAVIDFDRIQYSFLHHDAGRAILALTLEGEGSLEHGKINLQKARAFIDGYSEYSPLRLVDIADVLRATWCIESIWWIQPEIFDNGNEKVTRFKNEIMWLTRHWFELDSLFA